MMIYLYLYLYLYLWCSFEHLFFRFLKRVGVSQLLYK